MPWIQDTVRDERPLYTSGQVLVLAGDRDVQTDMINSEVLHMNFQSLGVASISLVAVNTGHGALFHKAPDDRFCGYKLLINFIHDQPLQTACLATSTFTNFATATYDKHPPLVASPAAGADEGDSTTSTNLGLAVSLAVCVVLFVAVLGLLVLERRRHSAVASRSIVLDEDASTNT